jgi:Mor family transcriptional regulator
VSEKQTRMGERRHEMLADLVAVTKRVLVDEDVRPEVAEMAANAVADRLADIWGGQVISFPQDFRRRVTKIELEIYSAWSERGTSFPELAMRYKMHERSVRRLIARVRARVTQDEQQALFEPPEGR